MTDRADRLGPFFTPQEKSTLIDSYDLAIESPIAAAGSGQSTAATSLYDVAVVTTATSASADCFKLRDCQASSGQKKTQFVINRASAQVRVFPPTGGILNGTTNGSVTLSSASHGQFVCINQSTNEYVKL